MGRPDGLAITSSPDPRGQETAMQIAGITLGSYKLPLTRGNREGGRLAFTG